MMDYSGAVSDGDHADVVFALAASPDFGRDGVCFAARASGLYRSVDGGDTWQPTYTALKLAEDLSTPATAVSPDFTSDHSVFAGVAGAVLRSHDAGETWYLSMLPTPPPVVSCLVASPDYARDGVLFAGTMEDGVFRSSDRGDHWVRWNFGLLDLHVLALALSPDFARDETLFVGTESGIFRSTNGGRAWREVAFPQDQAPVISLTISPAFKEDGVLLVGTEASGLHITRDGGKTWERLGDATHALGDSVNAILVAPDFPRTPSVLAVTSAGIFMSVDAGDTWEEFTADIPPEEGVVAVVAPQGLVRGALLLLGLSNGEVLRAR